MGVVYLAEDENGTSVALKTILPRHRGSGGWRFRARFRREIKNASRVRSPYTPAVLAHGSDRESGDPYMVTEFINGPNLNDCGILLAPPELRRLAHNLLVAIDALHEIGIVHRDIKPSNIVLSPGGPYLIDLGISKSVDDSTITSVGERPGTPTTMAPEQWAGKNVGKPCDVWAWACVVVKAATGRYPFAEPGLTDRNDEPYLGALRQPLRGLVRQALQTEPSARPLVRTLLKDLSGIGAAADPHDMPTEVRQLERLSDQRPRSRPRPRPRARSRSRPRRGKGLGFVAGYACVLALIAGVVLASLRGKTTVSPPPTACTAATWDGLAGRAQHPANTADRVRETANKLRASNPDLARKLDLVTYRLAPSPASCAGLVRYSFVAGSAAVGVDDATRVALSPDGRQLAVASVNTVRIFSLAELAAPREILSPLHVDASNERIFRLAFGADGRTLVAGTLKSVFLWDLAGLSQPRMISSADPRNAVDVSGLAVGTWSEDGTPVPAVALARGTRIELWKTGYGSSWVDPLDQRTVTTSVALSPDARRLAGGGKNGVVLLWTHDAVDKPVSLVLDEAEAVTSLAFSRDGERIATGTVSGKFMIWDLTDSTDPAARINKHLFRGQDGEIDSVMFGGRDTVVVAGNSAGAIRLWDVSGMAEPTSLGFLDVRGSGGAGLATSADGLLLATAVRGGGVQLWNLDPVAIAARLCKDKAARITDEEWAANLPGEPVQASCP